MKSQLAVLAALTLSALLITAPGHAQQPNDVSDFMQLKLSHAQEVLKALAVEDFDAMEKHSQELSLLSQAATWRVLQTPEYLRYSGEFRRASDALTKAAREKNLDGATLSYVTMTMKCIECHKYVRSVRMAQLNDVPHHNVQLAALLDAGK